MRYSVSVADIVEKIYLKVNDKKDIPSFFRKEIDLLNQFLYSFYSFLNRHSTKFCLKQHRNALYSTLKTGYTEFFERTVSGADLLSLLSQKVSHKVSHKEAIGFCISYGSLGTIDFKENNKVAGATKIVTGIQGSFNDNYGSPRNIDVIIKFDNVKEKHDTIHLETTCQACKKVLKFRGPVFKTYGMLKKDDKVIPKQDYMTFKECIKEVILI